jgi:DNA-binding PadR family transcriptional regulator
MRGGPGPWGGGPFQFEMRGGPFGPPRFKGGRGPRVRRGDVRAAILDLLAEGQSWNGYQLIQEIGERTQGVWRPSAGSVYPALQQLEDEGLITAEAGEDRRRNYTLTDEGRAYVEAHADELRASWDAVTGSVDDAFFQLHALARQVMMATMQVSQAGSPAQVQQASKILTDTRKALYRILAADDEEPGEDTQG